MPDLAILAAAGPCLTMMMASVAMLIVHRRLSQVAHALVWSASFTVAALQWAMVAAPLLIGGDQGWMGRPVDILGMAALLLFVAGFRQRAFGRWWDAPSVAFGLGVMGIAAVLPVLAGPVLGTAALALLAMLLLAHAGMLVVPAGRAGASAEIAVVAMLFTLALFRATLLGAALAEYWGASQPGALSLVRELTTVPATAASALFTMLLIAADFSIERQRLVHTDPLTGVLNRLGFEHAAKAALGHTRPRPISLAIADIDLFKMINDRYGHATGDAALVCVAKHLSDSLERRDLVGRIGGEEFALLLLAADGPAALARVEPVRKSLPETCADAQPGMILTASFGVAEQRRGEPLTALLERADRALYQSKRGGRDRSTLAEAAG